MIVTWERWRGEEVEGEEEEKVEKVEKVESGKRRRQKGRREGGREGGEEVTKKKDKGKEEKNKPNVLNEGQLVVDRWPTSLSLDGLHNYCNYWHLLMLVELLYQVFCLQSGYRINVASLKAPPTLSL